MKKIFREKQVFVVSIIFIILNIIMFPKKNFSFNTEVETQIAKAIIVLDKSEMIEKKVNRNSFPIEYFFEIKNFDNKNNINEIDLNYKIEIQSAKKNFPIKYKLIDVDNNVELQLINNKTELLNLEKNQKEIRHFKIFVEWNDFDIDIELADETDINIKIEAVQGGKCN